MTNNKLIPKIRFKEFENDEAWELRKLGDEVVFYSGLTYSPTNVIDSGGTLVLRSSNVKDGEIVEADNVYVSSEVVNSDNVQVGDVIVVVRNGSRSLIGKHAQIKKVMNNTVIGAFMTGVRYPQAAFLNVLLSTPKFYSEIEKNMGATINQITTGAFKEMQFYFPGTNEQKRIGDFFLHLDNLITLHQCKVKKLKELKLAYLSEMYPEEGEKCPRRRFAGFTDAWEQRKLGEIYQKIRNAFVGTATPYYVEEGHFYLESNNVKDGQINRNAEIFINDEFYKKQKDNWLRTNDIVMVQSGHVGHAAVIPENLDNTAAHALIIIANPREKINPHFVNYQFQTKKAKSDIDNITTGNTIKHILSSEMKNFEISVCDYEEQNQIGKFFMNFDNLITLHQRELEKLENIKKAYLNEMFV